MRRILLFLGLSWSLIAGNCVQESVIQYESPSEQYIGITGVIDEGMTYVVTVMYVRFVRESHCKDYDEKTGICRVKPQSFTYAPHIENRKHHVHVPLKELSPGKNSWWKPHDISLCVRPLKNKTHPFQCVPLLLLTTGKTDAKHEIDLVCTKNWRCFREDKDLGAESISELNKEYVVNIKKHPHP